MCDLTTSRYTVEIFSIANASRMQLQDKLPPGITLVKADDFREWLMDIRVMDDSEFRKQPFSSIKNDRPSQIQYIKASFTG